MTEGHITEIFSSFQGEGPYAGRRQIFIRFAGCPLSCFYCDTVYARDPKPSLCTVFSAHPDSEKQVMRNPLPAHRVLDVVNELITPDLHSIAYTGGEPLFSSPFIKEIAIEAKNARLKNFIETNGYSARAFATVADYFDVASIDIKLRSHRAVAEQDYHNLYRNAIDCVKLAVDCGIEPIVKVIVLKNTSVEELEAICNDLADLNVTLVLQPVTVPLNQHCSDIMSSTEELFKLSETAGRFLQDVMVLPQVHKLMRIP